MKHQYETIGYKKHSIIKFLVTFIFLFQFLLFVFGIILIIIAEIRFISLINEFSFLLIAHIAGILLPLFLIVILAVLKNNIKIEYLVQKALQNSIVSFLFDRSQKLICTPIIIYSFLAVTISIMLFNHFLLHSPLSRVKHNVVFLYPKVLGIPDIIFELAILPTVIAQHIKASEKHIVALPLLSTSINYIASNTEIIIIGAHGKNGYIKTRDGVAFSSSMLTTLNYNVKEVYFGSCYVGKDIKGWQEKYPNAIIFATIEEFNELQGLYYLLIIAPFKYS